MILFEELKEAYSYVQFATSISTTDGNCLHVNPKWIEITKLSLNSALDMGWQSIMHPDDIPVFNKEFELFTQSSENGIFNYRIFVGGKEKYIQKLSTPVFKDGKIAYYVCIITDLTVQKQQEQLLNQQNKLLNALQEIQIGFLESDDESEIFEELLRKILHVSNCAYGFIAEVLHEDGKQVLQAHAISNLAWNEETQKLYNERKTKGLRFENLDTLFGVPVKTGEALISNNVAKDARAKGLPHNHPVLNNFIGIPVKKDREVIGLIALANHANGFSNATIGFMEPITATVSTLIQAHQIKKAKLLSEEENREKAQYLQILLTSLDDLIFELNEKLEFTNVWTNDESKLFIPRAQFLGLNFRDFFPPEFCDYVEPIMKKVLETGEPSSIEYPGMGPLADKWYNSRDSRVIIANGEKRLIKQVRDITEIKNSEKAILKAKDAAEEATRIKSEFISVMSHEIRTPMNAIIGFINLLLDEKPQPHQVNYLTNLQLSATQLLYLLNNILDYSKLEAGKMQIESMPVLLSEVADALSKTFSKTARDKNIQLKTIIDSKLPDQVLTDPFRLNRVLTNLVSNAIKFTDKGSVTIELTQLKRDESETTVYFAITDTGVGISQENLAVIFEEFTQEHSSITRKYGGTGLGLAICNKLLQGFDSKIEVKSEKDKGSTFSFVLTLPVAKSNLIATENKRPTASSLNNVNILVVEDNLINAMIVQKFIKNWGGKSQHAISGKLAIDMAHKNVYDAILMDLQMPEMDGFETTKNLREFLPDTPIIALTADAMTETRSLVLASGMTDYVTKPFNPQELKGIIEHYCNIYRDSTRG
jgi:PAS domain S-box-containing protein